MDTDDMEKYALTQNNILPYHQLDSLYYKLNQLKQLLGGCMNGWTNLGVTPTNYALWLPF
jgi:hypothetical protein